MTDILQPFKELPTLKVYKVLIVHFSTGLDGSKLL